MIDKRRNQPSSSEDQGQKGGQSGRTKDQPEMEDTEDFSRDDEDMERQGEDL